QRTLGHHALEYLLVENVLRRRLHVLLLELLQYDTFGVVEIVLGDGLVVDHGDHPVHVDDTLRRRTRLRQRTGGCQRKSYLEEISICHGRPSRTLENNRSPWCRRAARPG